MAKAVWLLYLYTSMLAAKLPSRWTVSPRNPKPTPPLKRQRENTHNLNRQRRVYRRTAIYLMRQFLTYVHFHRKRQLPSFVHDSCDNCVAGAALGVAKLKLKVLVADKIMQMEELSL